MLKSAAADVIASKLKTAPNGLSHNGGATYGLSKSQFDAALAEHRDTVVDRDADYMAQQVAKGIVVTDPNVPSAIIVAEQIITPSGNRVWVHKLANQLTWHLYRRRQLRRMLTSARRMEAAQQAAWNRWQDPLDHNLLFTATQMRNAIEFALNTGP